MAFAIAGIIGASAAVIGTGYSIYASQEQQHRANVLANNAKADAANQAAALKLQTQLANEQEAEVAARNGQESQAAYTRDGTILSGSVPAPGSKTLLGT